MVQLPTRNNKVHVIKKANIKMTKIKCLLHVVKVEHMAQWS